MVTSDFRPEVKIQLFHACAMHPAIIIGTVRLLWTWAMGQITFHRTYFQFLPEVNTEVKFVQFWLVFAYLVAIATLFAPRKIQIAYLNSTTPKPYHMRKNWHYIAYRTEICTFLAFLCKLGCYGNSLCSTKIFISIFEFSNPENLTIHANTVSIVFTELKSVEFWFILT